MTATIVNEVLGHTGEALLELEAAANGNPEVLKLFTRLQNVTARFARDMERCQQGAKFLGDSNKISRWTVKLYKGSDEAAVVNLYNCIRATRESLKCGVYKTFRDQDIPMFAQTPVEVYQEFLAAFNQHVSVKCADKQVAKVIQQYATTTITQLVEQILNEKSSNQDN